MAITRTRSELKCNVEAFPDVPKLVILKLDVQRRGVRYTQEALALAADVRYQHRGPGLYGRAEQIAEHYPESLLLRDGTSILTTEADFFSSQEEPYVVDVIEEKPWILDGDDAVEEVEFWLKPDYYGKKTSRGVAMENVAMARPQRLDICPYGYCHFWDDGNECRFCSIVSDLKSQVGEDTGRVGKLHPEDVFETVREALKEPGRWLEVNVCGGSDTRGDPPFDVEVDRHIELLQAIGRNFKTRRFSSQLIATAFSKDQLRRIYDETGLTSYCADIEVWDERLFGWICPGKDRWIGWEGWVSRLIDAVDIFGKGNVFTNIVAGVELAEPYGFKTIDEAVHSTLEGCDFLAERGVAAVSIVWNPRVGSALYGQTAPPLEYYVRIAKGFFEIRKKHGLTVTCDDYKHCGNHADTDLSRLH